MWGAVDDGTLPVNERPLQAGERGEPGRRGRDDLGDDRVGGEAAARDSQR